MKRLLVASLLPFVLLAGCGGEGPAADAPAAPSATSKTPKADSVSLQPTGFLAMSLPEIARAIREGETSAEDLVSAYLARIDAIDVNGPALQSVLTINPSALEDARALDAALASGDIKGPLHGVPILLKDNIESKDPMPTTAGALALADNMTNRDSPLVAGLREAGAIILGKTNLSQWANFRSEASISGWSALGGQVRNPHMLDRSPCGSSSGTGAGIAASLAAGGVGTETNGSIICPSNVNGIVGFKPTVGIVPQDLIVPISSSQDTAGPMTKTVEGAAMMLTAMAVGGTGVDYAASLDAQSLQGARIGVMRFAEGSNADIKAAFDAALDELEAAGAVLVEIEEFKRNTEDYGSKSYDVLKFEFKDTLNDYLANAAPAVSVRSLEELIAFNEANADVELALFNQDILEASLAIDDLASPDYLNARTDVQLATRADGIDKMLNDAGVVALVSPSGPVSPRVDPVNGDVWPDWAGAGYLAAVAGYSHLTVPMGNVHGIPIGLSIMGTAGDDARILSLGYAYEQRTNHRAEPAYLPEAEARTEIAAAMKRR